MGLIDAIGKIYLRLAGKAPPAFMGSENPYLDLWRSVPAPTKNQLIDHYKEVVYACASINAMAVASLPLRLYVQTGSGQAQPKCATKRITKSQQQNLFANNGLSRRLAKSTEVAEVVEHPLLTLLENVNQFIDGFTLFELSQLYQEIEGNSYWYVERDGLGIPTALWVLPPQQISTLRDKSNLPRGYKGGTNVSPVEYSLDEIIPFRMPNLKDPYGDGWSPARAVWESISLLDKHTSHEMAWLENEGLPSVLVSPKDALGTEEAERLEYRWNKKFRRGGSGKILVGESSLDIKPLNISPKDLEILAAYRVRKEAIANGYGIPMALLTSETNLANLQAARQQHALLALLPRCRRNEQKLNQMLCPMFDERLFLAYDNPVPEDVVLRTAVQTADGQTGDTTINERREERGLPPVAWGDKPWMPFSVAQVGSDFHPSPADENYNENADGNSDETEDEKSFEILARYHNGDCGEIEADKGLRRLAWDDGRIAKALRPVEIREPRVCHHERDAEVHDPEWHKITKAGGHRRRLPRGERLREILVSEFHLQQREVLASVGKSFRKVTEWYNLKIDRDKWNRRMADKSRPFLEVQWGDSMRDTLARVGRSDLESVWNVSNPRVRESVQRAAMLFSSETNETTSLKLEEAIHRLRQELAEGIVGTENTIPELTRRVRGVFDEAEQYRAERIAITESSRAVHDAQRMSAEESGVVGGFKWLLSADACEQCVAIAAANPDGVGLTGTFGTFGDNPAYQDIYAPPLHPNCVLPGMRISGIGLRKAFVADYDGPVVQIVTASGRKLSVTANDMLLTTRGFVAAHAVRQGDEVIEYPGIVCGDAATMMPDYNGQPTPIEEIIASLAKTPGMTRLIMPVTAEDFHGDAASMNGKVNIVTSNRELWRKGDASIGKGGGEGLLSGADMRITVGIPLVERSDFTAVLFALRDATNSGMGGGSQRLSLIGSEIAHSLQMSVPEGTPVNPVGEQNPLDDRPRHAEALGDAQFVQSVDIGGHNGVLVKGNELSQSDGLGDGTQLDAGGAKPSLDCVPTDTERLGDCLTRFAGQIAATRIVEINIFHYRGRVYDVETESNLYVAEGIVKSNCMCTMVETLIRT